MHDLLQRAATLAADYLAGLDERPVAPSAEAVAALSGFNIPLPDAPTPPDAVLDELNRRGSPATMAAAGGRFYGFVHGGALPAPLAAATLAAAWDQNAALHVSSPVASALEEVSLGWLRELFHLPADCAAAFVTGATMANFTALATARSAVLARAGWDVEAEGLSGAPAITVLVGGEAHPSVIKALGLLGLGRRRVQSVEVDSHGRMRPAALPPIEGPTIICAQAGNVNSGAFDPFPEICARAHEAGAWVHVDGAFGLWALASPAYAALAEGVQLADSWATDAHKWLNVPYDSGLAFVRDEGALLRSMSVSAAYIPRAERRDPAFYTPELSRRARGVEVWAALRSLGRQGLADLIDRTCRHARRFADGLRAAGFEILNDVVLNQVLVSFGDDEKTARVIDAIQRDGTCWCGGTRWQGRPAMRICTSNWITTDQDVERSLAAMIRLAQ
jgi:glutamate/tyrosine decarboxylase-like PLP-dependent enzyme